MNNIETVILKRKDHPDGEEYSERIMEIMENYSIDLIVLAGFSSVLSSAFTKKYENRIMNTHPTLIPAFCGNGFYGIKVHEKVLERGVKISGATVHFANEITDGGPIIMQKAIDVKDDDTPESLQKRIMVYGEHVILPQAVNLFCNDRLKIENDKVKII
ncbi:phosphoribosylglycinamide formyltransferase [Holotrichia oblita]|nr:phosphoribosylglycinamide formyltransferase [Holotrichia oblita]